MKGTIAGVLSHNMSQTFESGSSVFKELGWWKLRDCKPPTVENGNVTLSDEHLNSLYVRKNWHVSFTDLYKKKK